MDELKALLKEKIEYCAQCINSRSTRQEDSYESEAIEHLSRALSYLCQIKEDN